MKATRKLTRKTNAETNTETNTETNMKADATTGISEAYTLEESNSATTSEETVTDEDGFWSGESETVESFSKWIRDGWESAEMDGAEAGDEAVKRDAAAFVRASGRKRRGNWRDR